MGVDIALEEMRITDVFNGYLTHNLVPMARAAGIYEHIWHPGRVGAEIGFDLVKPLSDGLDRLMYDPDTFRKLEPDNRFGTYETLVEFVQNYLRACTRNYTARIRVFS